MCHFRFERKSNSHKSHLSTFCDSGRPGTESTPPEIGHEINGKIWSSLGRWLGLQKPGLQRCWHTASSRVSLVCPFYRKYHDTVFSSTGVLALFPHLFFFLFVFVFYLNSWRQLRLSGVFFLVKFSSIQIRVDCIDLKIRPSTSDVNYNL